MKKILFLSIFLFLGCSQKTIYTQIKGNLINIPEKDTKLNKNLLLNKVDNVANKIFSDLSNKEKQLQEAEFNEELKNIYKQGF